MIIEIFFNEGTTKDGRKYKVPHTLAWGVDMTVQLNGSQGYYVGEDGHYYVEYDPIKAGFKMNTKGYITLNIGD